MRSRIKGIALIELLIVVILISTVATAFWNFYIASDRFPRAEPKLSSPSDSLADAILDEMAFNLRQARTDSLHKSKSIIIKTTSDSDTIEIIRGSTSILYFVDDNNVLVIKIGEDRGTLLTDVKSLKATALGSHNLLLTLSLNPFDSKSEVPVISKNYFKVAAVNFAPSIMEPMEIRN